jgi:hypothetical protein
MKVCEIKLIGLRIQRLQVRFLLGAIKIIRVPKTPRNASRGYILSSLMRKQGIALSIVGIAVLKGSRTGELWFP